MLFGGMLHFSVKYVNHFLNEMARDGGRGLLVVGSVLWDSTKDSPYFFVFTKENFTNLTLYFL